MTRNLIPKQIPNSLMEYSASTSRVSSGWSITGKNSPDATQNFHRRVDDYKIVKVFVYLTDVDMQSGPRIYVQKSSKPSKLGLIGRFTNQEVSETFGKINILYFEKPKGSMFIVDSDGINQEVLPERKDRSLLQIECSLNPIFAYKYQ